MLKAGWTLNQTVHAIWHLKECGYVARLGATCSTLWLLTDACEQPPGETRPAWLDDAPPAPCLLVEEPVLQRRARRYPDWRDEPPRAPATPAWAAARSVFEWRGQMAIGDRA